MEVRKFHAWSLVLSLFALSFLGMTAISEENKNITLEEEVIISVDSTNLRFSPAEITITEGDTVRFFWDGELLAHNAVEENNIFDSGDPERNVDYSFTFEIGMNGTYEFVCEPHEAANMIGKITVNPAPAIISPVGFSSTEILIIFVLSSSPGISSLLTFLKKLLTLLAINLEALKFLSLKDSFFNFSFFLISFSLVG